MSTLKQCQHMQKMRDARWAKYYVDPPGYRRCNNESVCRDPNGPVLPFAAFEPRKGGRYGLRGTCRACTNTNKRRTHRTRKTTDKHYDASKLRRARETYSRHRLKILAKAKTVNRHHRLANDAVHQRVLAWFRSDRKKYPERYSRYEYNKLLNNPQLIRPRNEYVLFAVPVHDTYGWCCVICESKKQLCAHHRINRRRLPTHLKAYAPIGVTLCSYHHKKYHRLYGNRRNTRKQFDEFVISELFLRAHDNELASTDK